jgi:hypothetical protein
VAEARWRRRGRAAGEVEEEVAGEKLKKMKKSLLPALACLRPWGDDEV